MNLFTIKPNSVTASTSTLSLRNNCRHNRTRLTAFHFLLLCTKHRRTHFIRFTFLNKTLTLFTTTNLMIHSLTKRDYYKNPHFFLYFFITTSLIILLSYYYWNVHAFPHTITPGLTYLFLRLLSLSSPLCSSRRKCITPMTTTVTLLIPQPLFTLFLFLILYLLLLLRLFLLLYSYPSCYSNYCHSFFFLVLIIMIMMIC